MRYPLLRLEVDARSLFLRWGIKKQTWFRPGPGLLSAMNVSVCCLLIALLCSAVPFTGCAGKPASTIDKAREKPVPLEKPIPLEKAETIKVDNFTFEKADFNECVTYLRRKSAEADPEKDENKRGLGFITDPGDSEVPLVTLSLKDTSIWEICQRLAKLGGLALSVSNYKIYFHAKGQRPEPVHEGEIFYHPPGKS